ncbi:hypothetical protein JTB14_029110 [Gonioctena quinquepunctata]|nr:hypothetical protein JTB14_029110 [Gonioctena quinquepunctata]
MPDSRSVPKTLEDRKAPERDPGDINSLRPITLLSELGKMLERIIIAKINGAMQEAPLISDNQYGFSREKSTVGAIANVLDRINSPEKHHIVIFLDIKGAFNNMWWPSLLKYLHETGLPRQLVSLLKSYLEDRYIEYYSNTEKVGKQLTKGCPQGSALGPLLWNLTVEPLLRHDWPGNVAVTVYADDIAVAINA